LCGFQPAFPLHLRLDVLHGGGREVVFLAAQGDDDVDRSLREGRREGWRREGQCESSFALRSLPTRYTSDKSIILHMCAPACSVCVCMKAYVIQGGYGGLREYLPFASSTGLGALPPAISLYTHTKTYHRAQRMLETQLAAKKD